jgi:hypothetical protein
MTYISGGDRTKGSSVDPTEISNRLEVRPKRTHQPNQLDVAIAIASVT